MSPGMTSTVRVTGRWSRSRTKSSYISPMGSEIGPVQMLVLGFAEPNFTGQIAAELDRIVERLLR